MASERSKPEVSEASPAAGRGKCFLSQIGLRGLLLGAIISSVVVMATSKQTELVPAPTMPTFRVPVSAKFNHSPAFIYFIAALSAAGLYAILSILASIKLVLKPKCAKTFLLAFALLDLLFVGIVASATGSAGAVAYIGLRGNDHVQWNKVCGVYDKFCRHIGSSVALGLFAAILLVLLSAISTFTLYKKIRD